MTVEKFIQCWAAPDYFKKFKKELAPVWNEEISSTEQFYLSEVTGLSFYEIEKEILIIEAEE